MLDAKIFTLFSEVGFVPYHSKVKDSATWICHGEEKSFMVRPEGGKFHIIKIHHETAPDGSFCSSKTNKCKTLSEAEFLEWLAKRKINNAFKAN